MINGKSTAGFEDFGSSDFKRYKNRLLIQLLEAILDEKGELTPGDLQNAYDKCMVLIQEDLELISKNWCFLRKSGDHSVNTLKCCLTQLGDAIDLERNAVELAHYMKPYVVCRLYYQPDDERLEIIAHLRNDFTTRSEEEITSGDISTFHGFFEVLGREMNAIDELTYGKEFKLKPALEFLLRELRPRIVLKIKDYYHNPSLGYDDCQFCNSCWVEEPDIKYLKYLPCIKTPEKLESFLALMFRRTFYAELRDFLTAMDRYFSGGFEK